MDAELQEIEERCNKATAGPWYSNFSRGQESGGKCFYCRNGNPVVKCVTLEGLSYHLHEWEDCFQEIISDAGVMIVGNYDYESGGVASTKEDAEFIAHARQDIPALLAEIKRLQERIDDITY